MDTLFLNVILCVGNNLIYTCLSNSINKTFLPLTDVPEMVSISAQMYVLYNHVTVAMVKCWKNRCFCIRKSTPIEAKMDSVHDSTVLPRSTVSMIDRNEFEGRGKI